MLFIALIVLVAMTLAGVALMRSVDTGLVVAGNMAFKQSAIMVADRGTQEAVSWLVRQQRRHDAAEHEHGAGLLLLAAPCVEPNWFDPASWTQSVAVNGGAPDASGNVVRYVIHRMCTQPDTPYNGPSPASRTSAASISPSSAAASGGSMPVGRAAVRRHAAALLPRHHARRRPSRHGERHPDERPRRHLTRPSPQE